MCSCKLYLQKGLFKFGKAGAKGGIQFLRRTFGFELEIKLWQYADARSRRWFSRRPNLQTEG